ncbi:MAG: NAD+ kinase [Spirochaetes bacterium GWD1_27_9]|nr:MAG: NAD+ kinase [Spirochaetes bacterium GWB1_27_13]OHD26865.1 MAG: NAD+ kinase [Spirochaetes bacterium GWC1_27_15]OHD43010.1 MAG: NAD+ kinase [Spirochaetes bacterium GWD1_27_9]
MEIDKIVIVTRLTRLEENIKRFNTKDQAKFYIEKRGQSFADYELEYDNYHRAKEKVLKSMPSDAKIQIIDREFLPSYLFGDKDLVVTLGQDGLVVNTAKYLKGQLVFAINPDIERFDGILLPYQASDVPQVLYSLKKDKFNTKNITMAKIELNDGQYLYAFNDFYVGVNSHISARYTLKYKDKVERQMSSGIIISTPAGSTGWLSSLYNMAYGINPTKKRNQIIQWEDKKLFFVVREPFKSKWSDINIVTGTISEKESLLVESLMPEKGIVFSDGMETDFLEFNSGSTAKIKLADKTTNLLIK